jgi:hypothetical protein
MGVRNFVWMGGVVKGAFPRDWSWRRVHDAPQGGGGGVIIHNNRYAAWKFLRVHNVEDGVKPREAPEWSNGASWLVRDCYFTAIRDDSIENDRFEPGTVEDSLFDGVHTFMSEQKESGFFNGGGHPLSIGPGEDTIIHVKRAYIRIYPTNAFDAKVDKFAGGGKWFKWAGDARAPNHSVVVEDSVFAVGAVPRLGWNNLRIPADVRFVGQGNWILWLGKPGAYEGPKPAGVTFLEGSAASDKWISVRNDWLVRHGLAAQDFPADYNPHTAPVAAIPFPN